MDTWRQRDAKRLQKQQYLAQAQKQPVPDTIAFNNKLQQWFSLSQSTHDESLQKQNHTLVDPDSLTTIFQYLSALQVAHSRLVSKTWNQIASSNSVWKLFARRDFGMNAQEMVCVMLHPLNCRLMWNKTLVHLQICGFAITGPSFPAFQLLFRKIPNKSHPNDRDHFRSMTARTMM